MSAAVIAMPSISPTFLLAAMVLLTALVLAGALVELTLRRARLKLLARDAGWEYEPGSRPELTEAVVRLIPAPGAANIRVIDVLRSTGGASRFTIARVDYSLGAVRQRRDNTRIFAIGDGLVGDVRTVQMAPLDLPRMDQYRHLLELVGPGH